MRTLLICGLFVVCGLAQADDFFVDRNRSSSEIKKPSIDKSPRLPEEQIDIALIAYAGRGVNSLKRDLDTLASLMLEYKANLREIVILDALSEQDIYGRVRTRRYKGRKKEIAPETIDDLLELSVRSEQSELNKLFDFSSGIELPSSEAQYKRFMKKYERLGSEGEDVLFKEFFGEDKANLLKIISNLTPEDEQKMDWAQKRRRKAVNEHYSARLRRLIDLKRFGIKNITRLPARNSFLVVRGLKRSPAWSFWISGQRVVVQGVVDPREVIDTALRYLEEYRGKNPKLSSLVSGKQGLELDFKKPSENKDPRISLRLMP